MPEDEGVSGQGVSGAGRSGLTARVAAMVAGVGLAGLFILGVFGATRSAPAPQLSSGAVTDAEPDAVVIDGDATGTGTAAGTEVSAVAIAHQGAGGRWIVVDSAGRLRHWDALHASFIGPDQGGAGPGGLAVGRDGRLAFRRADGAFVVQDTGDLVAGTLATDLTSGPVAAAAFHSRFDALVTLSTSGMLQAWDLRERTPDDTPRIRGLDADLLQAVTAGVEVEAAALSSDGSTLAIALSDRTLRIWRIERVAGALQLARSETAIEVDGPTTALALDGAGRLVTFASGSEGGVGRICLLVVSGGAPTCDSDFAGGGTVQSLALDHQGIELLAGWGDGTLELVAVAFDDRTTRSLDPRLAISMKP